VKDHETLEITELPPQKWVRDYKNSIEDMIEKGEVKDIKEFHTENRVHFVLKVPDLDDMSDEEIIKKFKLEINLSLSSMVLFDS